MAKIIGVLNQKGGAGKTTVATAVSAVLADKGFRVLLLDSDPQGSSLNWSYIRTLPSKFTVVGMPHAGIHKEIEQVSVGYDYVVIDGAPSVDQIARSAIMASDLVVIPVQPSPYDIWAAEDIVNLVTEAQIYKPMLKSAFVISRKVTGTALGKSIKKALVKYDTHILDQAIHQRVSYPEAAIAGETLTEASPNSAAAKEMLSLTEEIINYIEKN